MSGEINVSSVSPKALQPSSGVAQSAQPAAKAVLDSGTIKAVDAGNKAAAAKDSVEQARISVEDLQASIDKLNEFMKQGQRSLAFSVDEQAEEVVVRVTDRETNELVRQIPSEDAIQLKEHLDGLLGLLFSKRV